MYGHAPRSSDSSLKVMGDQAFELWEKQLTSYVLGDYARFKLTKFVKNKSDTTAMLSTVVADFITLQAFFI